MNNASFCFPRTRPGPLRPVSRGDAPRQDVLPARRHPHLHEAKEVEQQGNKIARGEDGDRESWVFLPNGNRKKSNKFGLPLTNFFLTFGQVARSMSSWVKFWIKNTLRRRGRSYLSGLGFFPDFALPKILAPPSRYFPSNFNFCSYYPVKLQIDGKNNKELKPHCMNRKA